MKIRPAYVIAAGIVAVAGIYAVSKMRGTAGSAISNVAGDLGYTVGSAAFSAVDGIFSGVVLSAGDAVGIPRTNQTECERAKAEGRTWEASFACPAGDFLKYLWN